MIATGTAVVVVMLLAAVVFVAGVPLMAGVALVANRRARRAAYRYGDRS